MFDSVLLPAPFSPSSACTSPTAASKSTPSFATTPGNRLVMPRRVTAAPEGTAVACRSLMRRGLALGAPDDALDEPVHRVQVLHGHLLAGRDPHLAALVLQRAGELGAGDPLEERRLLRDRGLRLGADCGAEPGELDHPVLHRAVVEAG